MNITRIDDVEIGIAWWTICRLAGAKDADALHVFDGELDPKAAKTKVSITDR